MKNYFRELNNSKGMSMLYALMYLLVLTVLGTVVLTSASSTLGRTEKNQSDQKNYFLVRSAVDMIRNELEGEEFTFSYVEERYVTETITTTGEGDEKTVTSSVEETGPYYMGDLKFEDHVKTLGRLNLFTKTAVTTELIEIYKTLLPGDADYFSKTNRPVGNPASETTPIDFSIKSAPGGGEDTVLGKLSIDSESYYMTIYLWTQSEDGAAYRMKVIVPANVGEHDGETTVTVSGGAGEDWTTRTTTYSTRKYTTIR